MSEGLNKKYKDRLFRLLFGDERYKKNALDLYNAVNGTSYTDENELEFNTIDDVIYMGMKNDTSFIVRLNLSIYEQQSTYNPNMPVRGLMYLGKLMDKYISTYDLNIYGHDLVKLPTPQYIVFYNGTEKEYRDKDCFEMRLSDAFDKEGCVEMIAKVYNINYGHSEKLMKACKALSEYALFVDKVRSYSKSMDFEDAVDKAVEECINEDILKIILVENKAEVKDMVLTEYNESKAMLAFERSGYDKGREEGREEGENRINNLYMHLKSTGKTDELMRAIEDADYRESLLKTLRL